MPTVSCNSKAKIIQTFKLRLLLTQGRHEKRRFDLQFLNVRLHGSQQHREAVVVHKLRLSFIRLACQAYNVVTDCSYYSCYYQDTQSLFICGTPNSDSSTKNLILTPRPIPGLWGPPTPHSWLLSLLLHRLIIVVSSSKTWKSDLEKEMWTVGFSYSCCGKMGRWQ